MADGSRSFNFPAPQRSRLRPGEIVVDLFAGGGGASEGLKQALGIDPALAYNHDELAIGMHAANHPLTQHHREDIWHADPRVDVAGRPIGWFHASPDCTHFSQAKGGQPRSRKTRALSWVVLKWVGQLLRADRLHGTNTAPRIISMENVWQILTWGPLVAKRCKETGRVIKMDGAVAARGECVPVENQQLVPDKRHSGRTWQQFVAALRALGYAVEWRKLVASDYGAGTSRERLFLLARRDGEAIVWPEASHGPAPGQTPRVTAADCLDFSIPWPLLRGSADAGADRLRRARGPSAARARPASAAGYGGCRRREACCGSSPLGEVPWRQHRYACHGAGADDHVWCWCRAPGRRRPCPRRGRRLDGDPAAKHGRRRRAHAAHHRGRSGRAPRRIQRLHGPSGTR